MWIAILSTAFLLSIPSFREMIKTFPITLGTSFSQYYRKTLQITKLFKWVATQIFAGKSQIVKEICVLEIRMWLIGKFELGLLRVEDKFCTITYFHGNRKFKVRFPKKRGPRCITLVQTADNTNVTEQIIEMMGPSHNFHGIPTTPSLLGYNGLKITNRRGMVIHYLKNDIITT